MLKKYIQYLNDNPKNHWFKAKIYGWGWVPVKWQGWATILVYVILEIFIITFSTFILDQNPTNNEAFLVFILPVVLLTLALILVCYKKGEKPRWQWGYDSKKEKIIRSNKSGKLDKSGKVFKN